MFRAQIHNTMKQTNMTDNTLKTGQLVMASGIINSATQNNVTKRDIVHVGKPFYIS